jgi:hypothetical protein
MAGPVEVLIVAGAFGIVGVYLYIASRFISEAEKEDPNEVRSHAGSS